MSSFQELDIEVDRADYRPAVLSILAAIRPQWKEEDICITVRSCESSLVLFICIAFHFYPILDFSKLTLFNMKLIAQKCIFSKNNLVYFHLLDYLYSVCRICSCSVSFLYISIFLSSSFHQLFANSQLLNM